MLQVYASAASVSSLSLKGKRCLPAHREISSIEVTAGKAYTGRIFLCFRNKTNSFSVCVYKKQSKEVVSRLKCVFRRDFCEDC